MSMTKTDKQALRGQILPPRYYLAECQGCGVIIPSNKLIEAVNFPDGDADVHCPHCNADDCDIMDLGTGEEPAAIAWNYQQKRIESLLDELEAAAKQNALDVQIKARLCRESNSLHDKLREAEKRIAAMEARTLTVKLPQGYVIRTGHPINESKRGVMIRKDGGEWLSRIDVEIAVRAAGIALDTGE